LTVGQSSQYKSCGKYSNVSTCKISHFSEVLNNSSIFISLLLNYSIGKGILYWKIIVGHFLHSWPNFAPTQPIFMKISRLPDRNFTKISRLPDRNFVKISQLPDRNFDRQVLWATLARVVTLAELPPMDQPPVTTSRL
jgi:hypothetical protein